MGTEDDISSAEVVMVVNRILVNQPTEGISVTSTSNIEGRIV